MSSLDVLLVSGERPVVNSSGAPACQCEPSASMANKEFYVTNMLLILIFLPVIATIGLIANLGSALIYTQRPMNRFSVNRYLSALALMDAAVCTCGIFVITADSMRSYSYLLDQTYVRILPRALPVILATQMSTIYLTMATAVDCFARVCIGGRARTRLCSTAVANRVVACIIIGSFLYNAVVFWELETVACFDVEKQIERLEICPTHFRAETGYVTIYKVYMYSVFMAILPFSVLSMLNCAIVRVIVRRRRAIAAASALGGRRAQDSSLMLVMVVMLFLCCNSVSLLVNMMELTDGGRKSHLRLHLIDLGNLLVVVNSSANSFVYLGFSRIYRVIFVRLFCRLHVRARLAVTDDGAVEAHSVDDDELSDDLSRIATHHFSEVPGGATEEAVVWPLVNGLPPPFCSQRRAPLQRSFTVEEEIELIDASSISSFY